MSSDIPVFHITKEMKENFKKTRDMLDSILETFEILEDEEVMKRIKQAEREVEEGETTSFSKLIEELGYK